MSQTIDTILISHATKDQDYVKELLKLITVTGIEHRGVKIICSSSPMHGIPGDVNIYDYLKQEISGNVWVIYVLSQNYYKSAACLNEMGATWVQNKKYSTFLTPNFEYTEIDGAIDPARISYKMDVKTMLNDFKSILLSQFNIQIPDNIWESVRDEALEKIKEIAKLEREQSKLVKVDYETVILEDGKIIVKLRFINNLPYSIDFTYFTVTLKDMHGTTFYVEEEPNDIRVHSNENKIFTRTYELEDSLYKAARNDSGIVNNEKFTKVY